jgi:hypothetical protein
MLVTLFDLQLEEEEEAKAATDKTAFEDLGKEILGKDEEIANAIRAATDIAGYTKVEKEINKFGTIRPSSYRRMEKLVWWASWIRRKKRMGKAILSIRMVS